jgi:hypothetical protein
MEERRSEQLENLQERLRTAAERLDQLRDEAAHLAVNLRNDIHTLALQRQAVQCLDAHRQERIDHLAQRAGA